MQADCQNAYEATCRLAPFVVANRKCVSVHPVGGTLLFLADALSDEPSGGGALPEHEPAVPVLLLCAIGLLLVCGGVCHHDQHTPGGGSFSRR